MRVSDLILVNHSGDVVYGDQPVNRAAFVIHAAIHAARPDVIAAAHSHTVNGKAFSSLGIPLDPITQDSCIFYDDHTVINEQGGAVVFEIEAGKELASNFPTGKAAIHQNHGLFTVGQTVDEAAFWFLSMERSCQAQLLAMAAGTPHHIDHEDASYTQKQTGLPARRLVQLPAAVAGDLPHRSRPVRLTLVEVDVGRGLCPDRQPSARGLAGFSPEALFVLAASPSTSARSSPCRCSTRSRRRPSPGCASASRAMVLLAFSWRQWSVSPDTAARRWTRADVGVAAIFGIAIALMNLCFYLAIDRLDLGKSVSIEFIGPIAVAASLHAHPAQRRRRRPRSHRRGAALRRRARRQAARAAVHLPRLGDVGDVHHRRLAGRPSGPRRRRARRRAGLRRRRDRAVRHAAAARRCSRRPSCCSAAVVVGLFTTVIGYGIDQHVLRRIPSGRFALLLALLPVTAMVMGFIALDQTTDA